MLGQTPQNCICCSFRGSRVLTGDQIVIFQNEGAPVRALLVDSALFLQSIFQQHWHNISQLNGVFFGVGEASDVLAFDQRSAVLGFGIDQRCGSVADDATGLPA